MSICNKTYLEHTAIYVKNMKWYIDFFENALAMPVREYQGSKESPTQYWTIGGLQFIEDINFDGTQGVLAHLGIMCEDLNMTATLVQKYPVTSRPEGEFWFQLPDGLIIELMQAKAPAVSKYLEIEPR